MQMFYCAEIMSSQHGKSIAYVFLCSFVTILRMCNAVSISTMRNHDGSNQCEILASSSIWQLMSLDFFSSVYSRKNPSIFRSLLWSMSHREYILTRFVIMDINFTSFYAHFLYSFSFFSFTSPPSAFCVNASVCMCALNIQGIVFDIEFSIDAI